MAFTVTDFRDLLRLLGEHPEWQAELRRLLVGEHLAAIDVRLERISEQIENLARETTRRFEAVDRRFETAEKRLTEIETSLHDIATRLLPRMVDEIGKARGWRVEFRLRDRAPGYFGRRLKRTKVVLPGELPKVREADRHDQLTEGEWAQLMELDILVRGFEGDNGDEREVFIALEASGVIDVSDVERASRRAGILRQVGYDVRPWVGGESILDDARRRAEQMDVAVLLTGPIGD